jgi:protein phosphatase 2C family protein 2/3
VFNAKLFLDPELQDDPAGCTAVVALVTSDKIIVANAGDSRCVLSRNGRAIPLSRDHKPKDADEYSRILAAGGYVNFGRVNGNLALSRAIGDFEFKRNTELGPEKQIITAKPDVLEHTLTDDDEFLIVACDGIWDCMPNQQVINFIRERLSEDKRLDTICEELMDRCLASAPWVMEGIGADNMTLIIVGLLGTKSKEEWIAQCSKITPLQHMGGGSTDDQMAHVSPDSIETSKDSIKQSLPDSHSAETDL